MTLPLALLLLAAAYSTLAHRCCRSVPLLPDLRPTTRWLVAAHGSRRREGLHSLRPGWSLSSPTTPGAVWGHRGGACGQRWEGGGGRGSDTKTVPERIYQRCFSSCSIAHSTPEWICTEAAQRRSSASAGRKDRVVPLELQAR